MSAIYLVNDKQKLPSKEAAKKAKRLAEALKRNIARRKTAQNDSKPEKN